jgi:hypothetical protein
VLELWEDGKGADRGQKHFRLRWLFWPHHLPARVARTLAPKQVMEHVDVNANEECNPLASMRSVQRVLC